MCVNDIIHISIIINIYGIYYTLFFLANIVWNQLEIINPITVGEWHDHLGNSDSKRFKDAKERIESEVYWLNII